MFSKIKDDFNSLPGWARVLFSLGIVASIIKWFPIIELLELFLLIVVIPLGFLTFLGLMSKETSNTIVSTWTLVCTMLREQIQQAGQEQQTAAQETVQEPQENA
jgi:hypothetical protein